MDEHGVLGHTAGFQSGHSSYNYYPQIFFDPQDPIEEKSAIEAHSDLVKRLYKTGAVPFKFAPYWIGNLTGMEDYLAFLRKLKRSIDPENILNPGIMPGLEGE
jgi:FAD/FMN-containing dehydrogenase